jgi:hypothetical protein
MFRFTHLFMPDTVFSSDGMEVDWVPVYQAEMDRFVAYANSYLDPNHPVCRLLLNVMFATTNARVVGVSDSKLFFMLCNINAPLTEMIRLNRQRLNMHVDIDRLRLFEGQIMIHPTLVFATLQLCLDQIAVNPATVFPLRL